MKKFYLRNVLLVIIVLIISGLTGNIFAQHIKTNPVQTAIVGESYTYDVNVWPTGDSAFYLDEYPAGMNINENTGLITWTPSSINDGGKVVVRATIGAATEYQSFYIYVSADAAVCDEQMVSYWKLDETSGTTYTDFKGGYDAITGVAPKDTAGMVGRAKDFDPANDIRLTVGDTDDQYDWAAGDDISVSLWFNCDIEIGSLDQIFIGRLGHSTFPINDHFWWFGLDTNNYVHVVVSNNAGMGEPPSNYIEAISTTGVPYQNGLWHHAVFTLEGDASNNYTLKIYVDSDLKTTVGKTLLAGDFTSDENLNIGWWDNPWSIYYEHNGLLDEIAFYKRVLSSTEISDIYDDGLAGIPYCQPGNYAPLFESEPVETVDEDVEYVYNIITSDYDEEDDLTISVVTAPAWLDSFTDHGDGTATLSGTPENDDVATHPIQLSVTDEQETIYQSYSIVVSNINDLPEFTTTPVTSASVGALYEYWFQVRDDEDDELTCEATVLPDWLNFSFNPALGQGLLQGTPDATDPLHSNVSLKVTDSDLESRTQSFIIFVAGGYTAVEDNYNTDNIKVYPSPAKDFIYVESKELLTDASIQILSMSGIVIAEYQLTNTITKILLPDLSKGIYLYKIISQDQETIGKIIKE